MSSGARWVKWSPHASYGCDAHMSSCHVFPLSQQQPNLRNHGHSIISPPIDATTRILQMDESSQTLPCESREHLTTQPTVTLSRGQLDTRLSDCTVRHLPLILWPQTQLHPQVRVTPGLLFRYPHRLTLKEIMFL